MSRKLLCTVLVAIMVVVFFSGCKRQAAGTIKIGVALPLTGTNGTDGNCALRGAQIAVKDINAAGGINGQQVELVSEDDQSDPKQAADMANLFVADPSIVACIADYNSVCTLAGAPIYNSAHLVHISVGSSSPKVSTAGPYTFRMWVNDTTHLVFDTNIVLNAGYTKVGSIYQNDDFGRGGLAVLEDTLAKKGLKVLVSQSFLRGEANDFNATITKMKAAGCDSVVCIADETELAIFAKQCAQQSWKPFIVSTTLYRPDTIPLGGQAVEGVAGDMMYDPNKVPAKIQALFDKLNVGYTGAETVKPNSASPCAYDVINMIAAALKNGAKTRDDIQKYLANLKNYDGVVGTLNVDENGDIAVPYVAIQIKGGQFVLYTGK